MRLLEQKDAELLLALKKKDTESAILTERLSAIESLLAERSEANQQEHGQKQSVYRTNAYELLNKRRSTDP
jgi:hypothetical protein